MIFPSFFFVVLLQCCRPAETFVLTILPLHALHISTFCKAFPLFAFLMLALFHLCFRCLVLELLLVCHIVFFNLSSKFFPALLCRFIFVYMCLYLCLFLFITFHYFVLFFSGSILTALDSHFSRLFEELFLTFCPSFS